MNEILSDIGEKEILNRLKKYMDNGQIDDDTAKIQSLNKELIINNDVLVENVHFDVNTTCPKDIGWKAITANLSDLASSGVDEVLGITVGLITPSDTEWQWVDNVYKGMKKALDIYGGKIIGGDCAKGIEKILSITAFGSQGLLDLHRSNAKPGDCILTTGAHGLSRLGLALLNKDRLTQSHSLSGALQAAAIQSHQRPLPRMDVIKELKTSKPNHLPYKAACTDSSDGLLEAINSLCESSQCTAEIDFDNLPRNQDWPTGYPWDNWCLNGGEDFELVISLPPDWAKALLKKLPSGKTIGKMKPGEAKVIWSNGTEIENINQTEFTHF